MPQIRRASRTGTEPGNLPAEMAVIGRRLRQSRVVHLRQRRRCAEKNFGRTEAEPLIVRSPEAKFRSGKPTGKSRYPASIKRLTFFVDFAEDFDLHDECIVIEAEKITMMKDL
jgi:hypothetical protein